MNKSSRIRKAIILTGGEETRLTPLTQYHSAWMLPFLNEPLIGHTVDFIKRNGITDIALTLSQDEEIPAGLMKTKGINFYYQIEHTHMGSAGAIKGLEEFIGEEPVLVIDSNLFIGNIDLNALVNSHFKNNSTATIGLSQQDSSYVNQEFTITKDNRISSFSCDYSSMDKTKWQFPGIYIFSPEVLRFIEQKKYMDIKEQLIPALLKGSMNVFACEITGYHRRLNNISDYININREILLRDDCPDYLKDKKEVASGIWIGEDVSISPEAYLLGPVILGDGCTVAGNTQIIGPAVFGNKCHVSAGVLVRESILWDSTMLSEGSKIEYSIIGEGSDIQGNSHIKNMIVLDGLKAEDMNLVPPDYSIRTAVDLSGIVSMAFLNDIVYVTVKRAYDIIFSSIGILFFLPLFLLLALAIKLDSKGPVFYIQKRCGIKGKLFGMIKFRTMVADAEKLHQQLIPQNELDGPVFKIADDPRVTRCGALLRKTSLDELPQLFNVLKGEMSLVGPRPLITDEMRFSTTWRDTRLKVKPGITGIWQVEGRSNTPFHDWIKYDMYYVKNRSFLLDMKILLKTIKVVLKKAGAY